MAANLISHVQIVILNARLRAMQKAAQSVAVIFPKRHWFVTSPAHLYGHGKKQPTYC